VKVLDCTTVKAPGIPHRFIICSVLFLFMTGMAFPASAQASGCWLEITGLDPSLYPEITLYARVRGENPCSDAGLPPGARLVLSEDGQQQDLLQAELVDVGMQIILVLDSGDGEFNTGVSMEQVTADALHAFRILSAGRGWLQPDRDKVMVVANQQGDMEVLAPFTSRPDEIISALNEFIPGVNRVEPVPESGKPTYIAVQSVLEYLDSLGEGQLSRHTEILLFTPGFMADLQSMADAARAADVRIHSIMAGEAAPGYWSIYPESLATGTGGSLVHSGSSSSVHGLFETFRNPADQLRLTYRTSAPGAEHHLELVLENQDIILRAGVDLDLAFLPPEVSISRVEVVEPSSFGQAGYNLQADGFESASIVVEAQVVFPDGFDQRPAFAYLYMDDRMLAEELVQQGKVHFSIDPQDLASTRDAPGDFRVIVRDELGFSARSGSFQLPPDRGASEPAPRGPLWWILAPVTLAAVGGSAYFLVRLRRRAPAAAVFQNPDPEGADLSTRSYLRKEAAAFLVPLEGAAEGKQAAFEIFGTTSIGRARRHADLLVQAEEGNSPISRVHCTILHEPEGFVLRDEDSANGTFLNGERLIGQQTVPLTDGERLIGQQTVPLTDGDILDLGAVERGGARLLFKESGRGEKASSVQDDLFSTQIKHFSQSD